MGYECPEICDGGCCGGVFLIEPESHGIFGKLEGVSITRSEVVFVMYVHLVHAWAGCDMVGYAFHDNVFLGLGDGGSVGFGTCVCVAVHACTGMAWDP